MKILFIGATGMLGKPVAKELIDSGFDVSMFVRDVNKAQALFPGAKAERGDVFDKPQGHFNAEDILWQVNYNALYLGVLKPAANRLAKIINKKLLYFFIGICSKINHRFLTTVAVTACSIGQHVIPILAAGFRYGYFVLQV